MCLKDLVIEVEVKNGFPNICAYLDGDLVGFLTYTPAKGGLICITKLVIAIAYQRKGIGTKLIKYLETSLKTMRVKLLVQLDPFSGADIYALEGLLCHVGFDVNNICGYFCYAKSLNQSNTPY